MLRLTAPTLKPWQRLAVLFAAGVLLGAVVWWPMFDSGGPVADGRYFFFQVEAAKSSFRTYGEMPFWNPFDCAGLPGWDHPEAVVASPLTTLLLPFSTKVTLCAWQLWHVAFGFLGMWLLCRDDAKASVVASTLAACAFAPGAWMAGQSAGLHATMMSFEYVPLLIFLWRRAEVQRGAAIGAGALVALMIFDGATYPLPFSILALAAETLTRVLDRNRARVVVARGLLAVATAIGLSGLRLLPLVARLGQKDRGIGDHDSVALLGSVWRMFTWRESDTMLHFTPHDFQWHEYVAYLGIAGLGLAALGLLAALREHRWTVFVAVTIFVIMLGDFAEHAPWPMLRGHVPPFGALRVASRFRHVVVIFACLWMALAIDRIPRALGRITQRAIVERFARYALAGLAFFAVEDQLVFASRIVRRHYEGQAQHLQEPSARFYYGGDGLTPDWMDQPSQNRAYTGCRSAFAFRQAAAIWTGDVPQVRAADDAVQVESSSRTHSSFDFVAVASRPGRVLVNSAYDVGWSASVGQTANLEELLAIDLPAGRSSVHVRYRPKHILPGLILTLLTALAIGLYFTRRFHYKKGLP